MTMRLELDDVACARGGRTLFSGLRLVLEAGGLLSVEGANGAGKTSLLRLIAGLLPPAAGAIALWRDGARHVEAEERAGLTGWLGHLDGVKAGLSVREQMVFWLRYYRSPAEVAGLLDAAGIGALADVPGRFLSAGQRRRLALARLMGSGRPLWLLDEPLAALDGDGTTRLGAAIAAHRAGGGLVVAATHEPLGFGGERLVLGAA